MKILFLSHYADMLGANRSLLSLVEGLKTRGVEVMVWCRKAGSFTKALADAAIPFQVFPYYNWADTFLYPGYWLLPLRHFQNKRILSQLIQAAKVFQPDLIHTNSSVLPIGHYLSEALAIPHVWHIREMARLHYNMRFFPSRNHLIDALKKTARVVVISQKVKEVVIGDQSIHWSLIYNGILDKHQILANQELLNRERNPSQPFRFLIIGMIHPNKGQMDALQAFGLLDDPNSELHIVGSGRKQYTRQLKYWAKSNGIADRVVFHGYVAHPQSIFQEADAVLMCSRNEGMGRVTVEAMAYGKPVIGLVSGATPELIDHQVNGLLYRDGPENLAKCMRRLVEQPRQAKAMGEQGWRKAQVEYTTEQYIQNMYSLFLDVLGERENTA